MRFFAALLFGVAALAALARPVRDRHVLAELVPAVAGVVPGSTFVVALRLEHDAGWHSYWIEPGTGYATSLTWDLPPGFAAGPIRWPTPKLTFDKTGNPMGNGYEGEVYLFVDIRAPRDVAASEVVLRARAEWLMCEASCVPGQADLELMLPVSARADVHPVWGERLQEAARALPQPPESVGISLRASRTVAGPAGGSITLRVLGAPPPAGSVRFFSEDGQVDYAAPQQVVREEGAWALRLVASPAGPRTAPRLVGDLAVEEGFADGVRSVRVDVAYEEEPSPFVLGAFVAVLGAAFLGGLILNMMPCVFPLLGLKVLGFVQQAGEERGRVVRHGLVFTAGVVLSFWVLVGVLFALRSGGRQLGWGFQLQEPTFVFVVAALLLAFALDLGGVFEVGMAATRLGAVADGRKGYGGTFLSGVLATVVATPCSAPFLGTALSAALTLPLPQSFALFTAIALGLSTPYLVLSSFPRAVRLLPRPGAWMETFKQALAFLLYASVAAMVWVLAGQVEAEALLASLLGLTGFAFGLWIWGRLQGGQASGRSALVGRAAAATIITVALYAGWPRTGTLEWQTWSPETVQRLVATGRPVYVDFTARWCFTCQTNKAAVFGSKELLEEFRKRNVALVRADWTNRDEAITRELARYGVSQVPFNLLYLQGRAEPIRLPELLTAGIVLKHLRAAADAPKQGAGAGR